MTDTRYNGWTNYETWNVALWMDNDAGAQGYWTERAREVYESAEPKYSLSKKDIAASELADEIQAQHDENAPSLDGPYADLLSAALSSVNWREIALNVMSDEEEFPENAPEPEEEETA